MQMKILAGLGLAMCILALRCGSGAAPAAAARTGARPSAVSGHDLAANMPPHLALLQAENWFGIGAADPQGSDGDASYGNWKVSVNCQDSAANPAVCTSSGDRQISSRMHPLAGIYSSSGRSAESLARIDLMLSNVRRSCDQAARVDGYAAQLNGTAFSSLHTSSPGSTVEIAYQAIKHFQSEAANAGMSPVVIGDDATYYWNNGHFFGLDCSTNRAQCIADLQQDVMDMMDMAAAPGTLRVGGLPLFWFYVDTSSGKPTYQEWQTIFANVRAAKGDFYAVASGSPSSTFVQSFWNAFDGLSPWINIGIWDESTGADIHDRAVDYASRLHSQLLANVANFPGRVVFGGIGPGFNDFTNNWSGPCETRTIPHAGQGNGPRDRDLLIGMVDYLKSQSIKGVVIETWDDWTEGSSMEPNVEEGPDRLVLLRQKLGELYGDASDPNGDNALATRWNTYGKARTCSGSLGTWPATNLTCGTGGGTVTGKVTNLQTGGAIANASVAIGTQSTSSDSGGLYTLSNVPAGSATLVSSANGYLQRSYTVSVTSGGNTTQNVQLSTSGKLVGNVTGNGAALAGATVSISGGQIQTNQTVTTDSTGHYDQGWVAIGNYTVTCSASGYSSQTQSATVSTGATTTVNCALSSQGSLSGHVTNVQTGGAISGATVSYSGGSTTTDSSGAYSFASISNGTISVTFSASGYLARTYSVTVGGPTTQDAQLSTSGKLLGNVTSSTGAALAGATVSISGGQIQTDQSVTTDSAGHYDEGWVPIGSYSVTCAASGYPSQTLSATVTTGNSTTVNCVLCDQKPTITEPFNNEQVGQAINLHASASSCVTSMNVYIDDKLVQTIEGNVSPVPPSTTNWIGGYSEGVNHRLVVVGYGGGAGVASATINFTWP